MGNVIGTSIVNAIQKQLEHFEDKNFNLHYKENLHIRAPRDTLCHTANDVLFFLKSLQDVEKQLNTHALLVSGVTYEEVIYRDPKGQPKTEQYIRLALGGYQEVFSKGAITVKVG